MLFRLVLLLVLILTQIIPLYASEFLTHVPYRIPKLTNIQIDGASNDWKDLGFKINILTGKDGQFLPIEDFNPKIRLAWDNKGLLVLASVIDNQLVEENDIRHLKNGDSVEIWIADEVGSRNYYSVTLTPGMANSATKARYNIRDTRRFKNRFTLSDMETGKQINENGYDIETRIPWARLGITPTINAEFALQIFVNDLDSDSDTNNTFRVSWFPDMETPRDLTKMYPLKLSDKAYEDYDIQLHRNIFVQKCQIKVVTTSEYIGKTIKLFLGNKLLASTQITEKMGRGVFDFEIVNYESQNKWEDMELTINDSTIAYYPKTTQVDYILDKYFKASGYKDSLARIRNRVYMGETIHDLSYKNPPIERIPLQITSISPFTWLVKEDKGDVANREGYDGKVGWNEINDSLISNVNQPPNILYAVLDPEFPLKVRNIFPVIEFREKKSFRGKLVYELKCEDKFGGSHKLRFDVESGLLVSVNIYDLKDYRDMNGLMVPHRIYTNRKGGSTNFIFREIVDNSLNTTETIEFPSNSLK